MGAVFYPWITWLDRVLRADQYWFMEHISQLFVATKAFILCEGKVLVLRESSQYADGTNAGKFDVPGGRLKPGERFDEALRREVLEETGLEVTIGAPVYVGEWRPVVKGEAWQIVGIFFLCTTSSVEVRLSSDHMEAIWVDPAKLEGVELIGNLIPAFEALSKHV